MSKRNSSAHSQEQAAHLVQVADEKGAEPSDFLGWFEEIRHHDRHHVGRLLFLPVPGLWRIRSSRQVTLPCSQSFRSNVKRRWNTSIPSSMIPLLSTSFITSSPIERAASPLADLRTRCLHGILKIYSLGSLISGRWYSSAYFRISHASLIVPNGAISFSAALAASLRPDTSSSNWSVTSFNRGLQVVEFLN